mmetsp:Transcript_27346/g.40372  ORF Transcript_27346/g.40372 Transcript_27346/m.40372 type:complete len:159 (-) Transcript_27346:185-661(-)
MSRTFGLGATIAPSEASSKNIEGSTPWVATSDGNLELLKESIKTLNMAPSAPDENGYTLLHAAAAYNQTVILEWLSTQSVNANAQDNDGDTPLHHVEHVEAAKFLVERMNADPKLCNGNNKTALQEKLTEMEEQMDDEDSDEEDNITDLIAYLKTLNH